MSRKTVVITGSTRGVGLAAAEQCLALGANVVISSESESDLNAVMARFAGRDDVAGRVCDVTDWAQVEGLVAFARDRFGRIDVWVNNAGTTAASGPTADVPRQQGELVIQTNILGTYHGSIAAVRAFRRQGGGRLINVVGRGEKSPQADANLYSSAKGWVRYFSLAMRKEEKKHSIEVGTFNPGLTLTELTRHPRILRGYEEKMVKGLRAVLPLMGDRPDKPGAALARYCLQEKPLAAENRSRSLLLLLLKRAVTGQRADIDINQIKPQVFEPET